VNERERRAEERRGRIVLRKTTLGDERDPWPLAGEDAVSLATSLTRAAWSMAGHPVMQTDRSSLPFRFVRRAP
jgi:hypothetical protein